MSRRSKNTVSEPEEIGVLSGSLRADGFEIPITVVKLTLDKKMPPRTSQKHRNIVSGPVHSKSVKELPGVGAVLGERLSEAGFDKASSVLGKYLSFQRDEKRFTDWMHKVCNANSKQASDCISCLKEYSEEFL